MLQTVYRNNLWWVTGCVDKGFLFLQERQEMLEILPLMRDTRLIALEGGHRTGKTTLLFQLVNRLMTCENIAPKRIFYFPCDHRILLDQAMDLPQILDYYFGQILYEAPCQLKQRVYVVLDEIDQIPDWPAIVKNWLDQTYQIKFIVSCTTVCRSNSPDQNTLAGRIDQIVIAPLTFTNYLEIHRHMDAQIERFLSVLPGYSVFKDPVQYFNDLDRQKYTIEMCRPVITRLANEYLLTGGYPEYQPGMPISQWQQRLYLDIVIRGLYKDVIKPYRIRCPEKLERLLLYLAQNQDKLHSGQSIGQDIHLDNNTAAKYLKCLEEAQLLAVIKNRLNAVNQFYSDNQWIVLADTGLRNAILHRADLNEDEEKRLVALMLVQLACRLGREHQYWVSTYRDHRTHVDLLLSDRAKTLPVIISLQNEMPLQITRRWADCCDFYANDLALVITRQLIRKEKNHLALPFWLVR